MTWRKATTFPRRLAASLLLVGLWLAGGEEAFAAQDGVRWRALEVPAQGKVGFTRLEAAATGLIFTNRLDEWAGAENRVLYNGAGVAVGDANGDGRPDVFLCDLSGHNRLFVNLGGWRFRDATEESGLGGAVPETRGAVFADVNGDGAADLLLSVNRRGVLVFLNDGKGKFVDSTKAAGTAREDGSTTLALADVDGNGTLDLYVANYRTEDVRDYGRVTVRMMGGRPVLPGGDTNRLLLVNGKLEEAGQPDRLYLNDGQGQFQEVSWTGGMFLDEAGRALKEPLYDWGLTATFRDVNGDGAPDLYVFNDYWTPDRFWINDGHGHFRAIARTAVRKTPASSMGGDFADLDRDGRFDFLAVDMLARDPRTRKRQLYAQKPSVTPPGVLDDRPQVVRNTLFHQQADGSFAELAEYAGLSATDWSWSPVFVDVDLDGFEDLLIGAGHFRDVQDFDAEAQVQARQRLGRQFPDEATRRRVFTQELLEHYRLYPLLKLPIASFRNRGDWRFEETTARWGFSEPGIHQGLALADFDGDGDLDLVVNGLNGAAALFRNDCPAGRVAIQLKGLGGNAQGIGARISLRSRNRPDQMTELMAGGRYLSGSQPLAVFGVEPAETNAVIEVHWRSGRHSIVAGVQANRAYEIEEASSGPDAPKPVERATPLFTDASEGLGHVHREAVYDDYARQALLPFKLSQLGPGVGIADLDGDGHEDVAVGTGEGGRLAILRGDGRGKFANWSYAEGHGAESESDLAGLACCAMQGNAGAIWWSVPTGYEAPPKQKSPALGLRDGKLVDLGDTNLGTGGMLAIGDMQGDGKLALFVAGAVLPGQYPRSAPSRLFRWERGGWQLDSRNSGLLSTVGLVQGAVWTDLTGDGRSELVVACEWGPLRVFRAEDGVLREVTEPLGLANWTGLWRGVASADVDGDGKLDLVAGNWGLNSAWRASKDQPLVLMYGELMQPGVVDLIETEYVGGSLMPKRQLQPLAEALPFLLDRFGSHAAYSRATLTELLGERAPLATRAQAMTLESAVFLNRGDHFEFRPLPRDAQWAPTFGVCAADFDGDGAVDLFLSQNFFEMNAEATRLDAGRGLCLKGDGHGQFTPMDAAQSGIAIYGEQRGAAVGDLNEDGRMDLVVAQNGAQTKFYQNVTGRPGLHVTLTGPPGNPWAVGAVVRLWSRGKPGAAHEIQVGSGYWSQSSRVLVLARDHGPEEVEVRWPGGRLTRTTVPPGAERVVVPSPGP